MRRSTVANAAVLLALATVPAAALTAMSQATARADSCSDAMTDSALPLDGPPCADVLAQEARWLTAITSGDRATVESILGSNFKHIDAGGKQYDRAQEIASTQKLPFTMNVSDQRVDIAGDGAVVHGLNTLMQDGKVLERALFTDVFVLQNGVWTALSAQETTT